MSWASIWAKAKENHARSTEARGRGKVLVIGAIFAGAGAFNLHSDVVHQIHGKPAAATLMAHLKLCTVEYRRVGEAERKEQLPCELAEAFQRRVGSDKVRLNHDYVARVQFKLEDGRTQEANTDDIKLGTYGQPIGTTVPVMYAPDNPADVRARMSWQTLKVPLFLLAVGIPFLLLALGGPLAAVFRRVSGGRAEETSAVNSAPSAFSTGVSGRSKPVFGSPEAQKAFQMYSTKPSAPRSTFGMRNR